MMKTPIKISDVQDAMKWFNALTDAEKLKHRKHIERNDAVSIARYWVAKIKQ